MGVFIAKHQWWHYGNKEHWLLMAAINLSAHCLSVSEFEKATRLIYFSHRDSEKAIVRWENVCHQGSAAAERQRWVLVRVERQSQAPHHPLRKWKRHFSLSRMFKSFLKSHTEKEAFFSLLFVRHHNEGQGFFGIWEYFEKAFLKHLGQNKKKFYSAQKGCPQLRR